MKKHLLLALLALTYHTSGSAAPSRHNADQANEPAKISYFAQTINTLAKQATTINNQEKNRAPSRDVVLDFSQIAPDPGSIMLKGIKPEESVGFNVRSDEIVTKAMLDIEFTPSPSLIPAQSHMQVFLNDELMGVIPITQEMLGKKNTAQLAIDPRYTKDFNRVKLGFVGHYINICENLANSTLWLDVSRASNLKLTYQSLAQKNNLSFFPEPFFDNRDNRIVTIPMVFPGQPSVTTQTAAAILASWFGTRADWRGQDFPILYNELPERHSIVFATNEHRPDFLKDHPAVNAPTIEMITHPNNPYVKLLVIMGRDDKDLVTAVKGIAQGNVIFTGQQVQIDNLKQLLPRKPYDAPNWVRTDRPMAFSELINYNGQLSASGLLPPAITVNLNLPPDLYLSSAQGIDMALKYRYTPPHIRDTSLLSISLNDVFIHAYPLEPNHKEGSQILNMPVLQSLLDSNDNVTIPALKLGAQNQLRFKFEYTNPVFGGTPERCETYQQVPNYVVIDDSSTVDFSGYRHFMAMPDLQAFISASFPFSRMADLSETLVFVDNAPTTQQLHALLNMFGLFGAQIGYPALQVRVTDDWQLVQKSDADLLIFGTIPSELTSDDKINLLIENTKSWVKMPIHQSLPFHKNELIEDKKPESKTEITGSGTMAAIIGFESPFYQKRSVVAILADGPHGHELFTQALNDSGKRAAIFGSTAIIRDSGVNSLKVGDTYYVGHIPWWERIWYALANHPVILAAFAVLSIILLALVLWRILRHLSSHRLSPDKGI